MNLKQPTGKSPSMQAHKHQKGKSAMSRIIAIIAILGVVTSVRAAEFVFPGWGSTDAAAFEAQLPNADSLFRKVLCASLAEFCRNKPADFAAMKTVVENTIAQYAPNADEGFKLWVLKEIALNWGLACKDDAYIRDAWAYCLAHPSPADAHFISRLSAERLGTTEAIKAARAWELLAEGKNEPRLITRLLQYYVQYLPTSGLPTQDAYEQLTTLNRVYTPKLIENKTTWEPIVAQIRTVMEAYK